MTTELLERPAKPCGCGPKASTGPSVLGQRVHIMEGITNAGGGSQRVHVAEGVGNWALGRVSQTVHIRPELTPCICGEYVAVGRTGALATSPDGIVWTLQTSGFGADDIEGVTFGIVPNYPPGIFVAVGESGKLAVTDVTTDWFLETSSFGTTTITNVTWAPELALFVAVGESGKLATAPSDDWPDTWTQRTTGFGTDNIYAIEWSPGLSLFVIGGSNGTLATSPDGITWTLRTSNNGGNNIGVAAWSPDLGLFVVGSAGGMLTTSPDGITWTQRTSGFGAFDGIEAAVWSAPLGLFVIAGGAGTLATSPDGINWTLRTSTFGSSTIFSALWSDELSAFLIGGSGGKFATSPDGINWTARTSGFSTNMTAMARSICVFDSFDRNETGTWGDSTPTGVPWEFAPASSYVSDGQGFLVETGGIYASVDLSEPIDVVIRATVTDSLAFSSIWSHWAFARHDSTLDDYVDFGVSREAGVGNTNLAVHLHYDFSLAGGPFGDFEEVLVPGVVVGQPTIVRGLITHSSIKVKAWSPSEQEPSGWLISVTVDVPESMFGTSYIEMRAGGLESTDGVVSIDSIAFITCPPED